MPMWVDSLLRKLSPVKVVLLSLFTALLAFVLLGIRDTKRVDSLNPVITHACEGFLPDIFDSTKLNSRLGRKTEIGLLDLREPIRVQECAKAARDQFSRLVVQSVAIGLGMAVVLAGLARSGARRRDESASGDSPPIADQLQKLVQLHDTGGLSDDEFAAAKRTLLG